MKTLKTSIELENAAFENDADMEISRILTGLARRIEQGGADREYALYDVNGNNVGTCKTIEARAPKTERLRRDGRA